MRNLAAGDAEIEDDARPGHDRPSGRLSLETGGPALPERGEGDFLSQILGLIRRRGEQVFRTDIAAGGRLPFAPGAAAFPLVEADEVLVTPAEGHPVLAVTGDLVILPQERAHRLSTSETPARLISGTFRFEDDNMPPMLAVLPAVIHVPATATGWMADLARTLLAEGEADRPGTAILISRLIDGLVIKAMRLWVHTAAPEDRG